METAGFEVLTAEDGSGLKLAMQRLWLTGQILPIGARLLVRHVFRNGEDRNLEVVYGFMLPRDAARVKKSASRWRYWDHFCPTGIVSSILLYSGEDSEPISIEATVFSGGGHIYTRFTGDTAEACRHATWSITQAGHSTLKNINISRCSS